MMGGSVFDRGASDPPTLRGPGVASSKIPAFPDRGRETRHPALDMTSMRGWPVPTLP